MTMMTQLFTGKDNQTLDVGRILWAAGVLEFLVLTAYHVVILKRPFDVQSYGIGFGAVLAGGGMALGLKSKAEPGG